jgi:hypothetical protein
MAIRHNSPVAVITWPNGTIEVTQVIAYGVKEAVIAMGGTYRLLKVQGNTPESVRNHMNRCNYCRKLQ